MRRSLIVLGLLLGACGAEKPAIPHFKIPQRARAGIVNGTNDPGDPAVVDINYVGANGSGSSCSGELIGPRTVLTAGHCSLQSEVVSESGFGTNNQLCTDSSCLNSNALPKSGYFVVYVTFGSDAQTAASNGDYVQAVAMSANPNFCGTSCSGSSNDWNDIGLIELSSQPMFSGKAKPAPLQVNTDGSALGQVGYYMSGAVRYVGFGITGYTNNDPSSPIQDQGTKREVTKNTDSQNPTVAVLTSKELEEVLTASDDGLTCSGDSGGPAFFSIGGVEKIIAVTSRGDQTCAQGGIDTRVDPYVTWINSTMQGWGDPPVNSGSTGSTTGSGTTTGSTTGSSGTTGSDPCTTCEDTAVASGGSCNGAYSTCANDTNCTGLSTCYRNCSGQASSCYTNCNTQYGQTAVNEYNAYGQCICYTACNAQCASSCGFGSGAECSSCQSGADCSSGLCIGSSASGECSGRICTSDADCNTAAGESCLTYNGNIKACFYTGNVCPSATTSTSGSTTSGSTTTSGSSTTGSTGSGTTTSGTATSGGTTASSTGGGNTSGNPQNGNGGAGSAATSTGTTGGGASSGGCGSAGVGELGFAMLAVLPLVRRRRRLGAL